MTLAGALLSEATKYNLIVNRAGAALPTGVILSGGYISADNVATLRIVNLTGSAVTVGSIGLVVTGLKILN